MITTGTDLNIRLISMCLRSLNCADTNISDEEWQWFKFPSLAKEEVSYY